MDRLLRYDEVVEILRDRFKDAGEEPPTGGAGADLLEYGSGCGAQHSPEWKHSSCVRAANSASKRAYSEVSAIARWQATMNSVERLWACGGEPACATLRDAVSYSTCT